MWNLEFCFFVSVCVWVGGCLGTCVSVKNAFQSSQLDDERFRYFVSFQFMIFFKHVQSIFWRTEGQGMTWMFVAIVYTTNANL